MRWLFLFVLIINIAYIVWEMNRSPKEDRVAKTPNNKVASLVMISELEVQGVIPDSVEKVKSDQTEVAVEITTAVNLVDDKALVVDVAAVDDKKAKSQLESATKPEVKTPEKLVEKVIVVPDACYTLGPFREIDKLREFTRVIKDYVVDVSFRSREEQESSMFWVYLPPAADFQSAQKTSKRLISKKIKDYYIINSGQKKNGISLGHFKVKDSAYNHVKRLKKLGFKPEISPIFQAYVIYWLDYQVKFDKQIPKKLVDKHMTKNMSQLNRECRKS